MNYLNKIFAVGCVAILASLCSEAMAVPSIPDDQTNAAAQKEENTNTYVDIDVASFLIRNLYREPDKDLSEFDKWYRGWAVSLYWNPTQYLSKGGKAFGDDFVVNGFGAAVMKSVSPASTFRLSFGRQQSEIWVPLTRMSVGFDYMFNISNFYYGYDLTRRHEWLLTLGVQGNQSESTGRPIYSSGSDKLGKYYSGGAHLGLQYRKNIANDVAFFIETQFAANTENWDLNGSVYDIDPGLNLLVGLTYRLGEPKMNVEDRADSIRYSWAQNAFFQMYGGSSRTSGAGTPFDGLGKSHDRFGMNFGFNVGKWLNPSLGLRAGYFEQIVGHNQGEDRIWSGHTYNSYMTLRGGRAEIIFNPLTIFADKVSVGRVGVDVSAGIEVGQIHMHKYGYRGYEGYGHRQFTNNDKPYFGVTSAAQFHYFVNDHASLFLEGRISNLSYDAERKDGFNALREKTNLSENIYSASVGLEYYLHGFDRYDRWKLWDTYETRPIDRLDNNKRVFVEFAGGLGHQIHWGEHFPRLFDIEGSLALGMRYNDYVGGRARFSYTMRDHNFTAISEGWGFKAAGNPHSSFRLGADAMVNLTNLWMGLDKTNTRMADVYLFAGPLMGGYTDGYNFDWGGNVGVQVTRRLAPEWELFFEPRYEFFRNYMTNRWDLLAGVIYYYNSEKNQSLKSARTGDLLPEHANTWFMELGTGASIDVQNSSSSFEGPNARFGLGRRFNPLSSIRLLANVDFMQSKQSSGLSEDAKFYSEVDYMLNLSNLWYGIRPERKNNLRIFGGPTFNVDGFLDYDKNSKVYLGWAAGVQWTHRLTPSVDMYLEPRFEDQLDRKFLGFDKGPFDDRFQVAAGLIFNNRYNTWRANHLFYNKAEHYPLAPFTEEYYAEGKEPFVSDDMYHNWFYEFALGISHPMGLWLPEAKKADLYGPMVSLGVGYSWGPYSAIRMTGNFDYQKSDIFGYGRQNGFSFALDYRFNVTNWVMGINNYRPVDLYVFGGPQVRIADWSHSDFKNTFSFGAMGGAKVAYHASDNFDIFIEPRYNLTNNSGMNVFKPINDKLKNDTSDPVIQNSWNALAGITWYNRHFDHTGKWSYDESLRRNNMFYQLAGGLSHALLMTDNAASFDQVNSKSIFGAVGYTWGPLSSLRFALTSDFKRSSDYDVEKHRYIAAMGLDYMFNASNWLLGVNPYRRVDVSLLAGPQARIVNFTAKHSAVTSVEDDEKFVLGGMLGAHIDYHIANQWDVFTETRYEKWMGKYNDQSRANIYAGLTYYSTPYELRHSTFHLDGTDRQKNWFTDLGVGATYPRGKELDVVFGASAKVGIGYEFGPYSSIRGSLLTHFHNNTWNKTEDKRQYVTGADLEYMLNLTRIAFGENDRRRTDIYGFVGPALRLENFTKSNKNLSLRSGIISGAQANIHLSSHYDVFVEGQYESWAGMEWTKGHHTKVEDRMSAYVGTRIYNNPNFDTKFNLKPHDINDKKTWFAEVALGLGSSRSPTISGDNKLYFEPTYHLAVGNHINNYSSLRFRTNFTTVSAEHVKRTYEGHDYLFEVAPEYMLNLTNAVLGLNPYRRFDFSLYAGPTVRLLNLTRANRSNDDGTDASESFKIGLGANGGGQLAYHVNEQWDIIGEGRLDLMLTQRQRAGGCYNRYEALMGLSYRFDEFMRRSHVFTPSDSRLFTQMLVGYQLASFDGKSTMFGQSQNNASMIIPNMDYRLGYHLNSALSIMGGIFANNTAYYDASKHVGNHVHNYGIQGELALNAINLFNPDYDITEGRFNWTLNGGVQLGRLKRSQNYDLKRDWGLTAATQLQYRFGNQTWAILEGRARQVNLNGVHLPMSASLGVQYDFKNNRPTTASTELKPKRWYIQGGAGIYNATSGAYELGIGYNANSVSDLRVMGVAGVTNLRAGNYLSVSADYICNITNAIFGHDDNKRHVDFSLLAGADLQIRGVNKELIENHSFKGLRSNGLGYNFGGQISWHLGKLVDLYVEPRFTSLSKDCDMVDEVRGDKNGRLNFVNTLGLKYKLNL